MKAVITGGSGFAASHLAEYLLREDQEVIALVRPDEKDMANLAGVSSRLRIERADVCDPKAIFRVLCDIKPERLYHLAAMSSPSESLRNPKLAYDVNFGGTLNVLLALRRLEIDCRLLLVSSAEVYGPVKSEDIPLQEETPLRPSSPYAGSKAAAEMLALQFFQNYKMPIVRARPFNHTGPRQAPSFVCSSFARQIAEIDAGLREPIVQVGNLKVSRDFSDVRDVVRGYYLLLEKGEAGEVYQLGSGHSVSVERVLQILMASSSKTISVDVNPSHLRPAEELDRWGLVHKAEQAVGWKPQFPLEETLRDLKAYWQKTLLARNPPARTNALEA
ncbi:MAG TPA: GDP-mannose 4,6-dehydratase [Terriglobia bacterium]|nr:GDP-mannose 4,6-dehydratase [Terriglobia bacterium]